MNEKTENGERSNERGSGTKEPERKTDWSDPSVPVGNAPPMPAWSLVLSAIGWVGWVVFLMAMTVK